MNYQNKSFLASNSTFLMPRTTQSEKMIIYSILFVISSIGNTSAFITLLIKKKKSSKSRVRLLFLNLCVADLLVYFNN